MNYIKEKGRIFCKDENGNILAEVTYQHIGNNIYNIDHTFVDEKLRGQGIAKELVELAVQEIKKEHGKLQATCSYAKHYLEKNNLI